MTEQKCRVCERWADSGMATSRAEANVKPEVKSATVLVHRKGGKPPVPLCAEHLEDAQKSSSDLIDRVEDL